MERTYDLVFMFASKKIEGRVDPSRPARPARCSPLGSRAVAFGASYGPLARARRFCGAILAISACLSSAHAAGRGASVRLMILRVRNTIRAHPGLLIKYPD